MIFSIIYRTWASLRGRQLLRLIAPHLDCEAFGFVPGCEPSQLWAVLQGEIECALQADQPLCGLSTDLIRAFNNIPRQHTFGLAAHLGVPSTVTRPWRSFLNTCTREFELRGALSIPPTSSCGLPEGGCSPILFSWLATNFFHLQTVGRSAERVIWFDPVAETHDRPGGTACSCAPCPH